MHPSVHSPQLALCAHAQQSCVCMPPFSFASIKPSALPATLLFFAACAGAACSAPAASALPNHTVIVEGCTTGGAWDAPCVLACAPGFVATPASNPRYPCTPVVGGAIYAGGSLTCVVQTSCDAPAFAVGVMVVRGCASDAPRGTECVLGCADGYVAAPGSTGAAGNVC